MSSNKNSVAMTHLKREGRKREKKRGREEKEEENNDSLYLK